MSTYEICEKEKSTEEPIINNETQKEPFVVEDGILMFESISSFKTLISNQALIHKPGVYLHFKVLLESTLKILYQANKRLIIHQHFPEHIGRHYDLEVPVVYEQRYQDDNSI